MNNAVDASTQTLDRSVGLEPVVSIWLERSKGSPFTVRTFMVVIL